MKILLCLILFFLVTILLCGFLYWNFEFFRKIGIFKKIYHDMFGWHIPGRDALLTSDGVNIKSTCEICHEEIMRDSQGNWF